MSSSLNLSDKELCSALLKSLDKVTKDNFRFMEVCGTHTVSIFRSGLRSLLPARITHVSGPGCPVCVTHASEVAAFLSLVGIGSLAAEMESASLADLTIATFGDLLRVPGPEGVGLATAKAKGGNVTVVYSPFDALELAKNNPGKIVVFLGVGFETTAPGVAATIKEASRLGVENFMVLSMHKLVPPALKALLAEDKNGQKQPDINGFLLPGHVCAVTGMEPFRFLAEEYGVPAAITGFEPADILAGLITLANCLREGRAEVKNVYPRVVNEGGSPAAQELIQEIFDIGSACWRGFGVIPDSGLFIRSDFADFDAVKRLQINFPEVAEPPGCRCEEVLRGKIIPPECELFAAACTPRTPVGACMVSTEGSCAAFFKYAKIV